MTEKAEPRRAVVVGVDESKESQRALRWAGRLASWSGAELDVVAAWQRISGPYGWVTIPVGWDSNAERDKSVQKIVDKVFGSQRPTSVNVVIREADPAELLIEHSRTALMVVVGSRGLGGFGGILLGSVSRKVAEHAKCPVLVVHGEKAVPVA